MKHVLEESKLFPIVAWIIVISFVLFVLALTRQLQATANQLSAGAEATVKAIDTGKVEI